MTTKGGKVLTKIRLFKNSEFGEIQVVEVDGEPWFVARVIANVLGYSNTSKAIGDHVDEEDKGVTKRDTPGGVQEMTIINESGLYSLVLSSKLPSAKRFKRWVTSEVIPSIRKHGAYVKPLTLDNWLDEPDRMIEALQRLKEERAARLAAEQKARLLQPHASHFAELLQSVTRYTTYGGSVKSIVNAVKLFFSRKRPGPCFYCGSRVVVYWGKCPKRLYLCKNRECSSNSPHNLIPEDRETIWGW